MGLAADDGVIAAAAAKGATITTYSAAGASGFIGWLAGMDWVAVTGVCIGGLTFAVNWYYKRVKTRIDLKHAQFLEKLAAQQRADEHAESVLRQKQLQTEHDARLVLMEHGIDPDRA